MRLRVLGPLEIMRAGEWHRLSAAKWRALLAVLAVHAGRPISIDRLVEELWPAGAPPTAPRLVHSYAARLRRAIDDPDGVMVRTRSPGYELVFDAADLDATQFEELAAEGTAALRAGDAELAATRCAAALELWRGPAFADVPGIECVQPVADRLEQLRLATLETRIEAELQRGHHADLVVELGALVNENPLRERLRAQLMLALYRCGRQAEALEEYQRVRRTLGAELGVEPSSLLSDLQQRILRRDSSLDLRADAVRAPRQLPSVVGHFVGRESELAVLDELAAATGSSGVATIAVISGPAGVGKTTTAVHWAHRRADLFPDGQLYVDLRGFSPTGRPRAPADVLRGLLETLEVAPERIPTDPDAQAALYRSRLAGRRMLLVLDNAHDAEHVRPLLPGDSGCFALITSRRQLTALVAGRTATPIALDLLTPDTARELLRRQLGPRRIADEPGAAEALITHCARLPLALTVVAARANVQPAMSLSDLAAELADVRDLLDALDTGDAATTVRAVFSWSYQATSGPAQRLFRLFSLHPGPDLAAPAAASLAGVTVPGARRLLRELTDAHLISELTPGRFGFHDLLRAYAAALTQEHDPAAEQQAALQRLLDHYIHTAYAAARLLAPRRDSIELGRPAPPVQVRLSDRRAAIAWFTAEQQVLLAMVEDGPRRGFDVPAWQLAWSLVDYLQRRGRWHDMVTTQRIALKAAYRSLDPIAQAMSHRYLARRTECISVEESRRHLDRALALATSAGDLVEQGRAHQGFGALYEELERCDRALEHAQRALALFERAGQPADQASALDAVGWMHGRLGDFTQTLEYCGRALALYQRVGTGYGEAGTWDSLGYAHHHLGDYDEAIACYLRCREIYRELGGDAFYEADTLVHLGDTHHARGDRAAAVTAWQEALSILEAIDDPRVDRVRDRLAGAAV
ncbi:MAG TPA: BTAD domain-containing putative transcriptional regulator [Mycobacteriales bacterium]|nr:BTAD domain-containing putative transcriptional regulator [Mycobacteriales bacterium]